jgi:hypothetical protein
MPDENIILAETIRAWADITIERWRTKIDRMGIGYTLDLENSLKAEVIAESGGNPRMVEFSMLMYGRFVDMGVGKGVTIDDVGSPNANRKPRPWYSRTFYAEVKKLASILAEKYARKGVLTIVENIDDNAKKWNPQTV